MGDAATERQQAYEEAFNLELSSGSRFSVGRNWQRFLAVVDDARIADAAESLRQMLNVETLEGRTFLDVGCGSGLFSLAAARLGARRVHSFDYDPQSVACARELKARYLGSADQWTIERGSILDREYVGELRTWDVVYSWGVLHHTGQMWTALDHAASLVAPRGLLYIAIYNDQGRWSRMWLGIKRFYNRARPLRPALTAGYAMYLVARGLATDAVRLRPPLRRYREYAKNTRGMSAFRDWVDWLGGYPFEVATPEAIFDFFRARGFRLARLKTVGGKLGCNEFVLCRE